MKRLRLRGDWSDTGPNARPETQFEAEASDQGPAQIPPGKLVPTKKQGRYAQFSSACYLISLKFYRVIMLA